MPETVTRYHCRHIHISGHRCGSPALRNESFCYYHHTTRKPAPRPTPIFRIPPLEDRAALQLAIAEVLNRIAQGTLDPKRAGLLLYGLQIAQNNLPPYNKAKPIADTVDQMELDQHDQPVAPTQEFQNPHREKTLEEIIVGQWEEEKAIQAAEQATREALRTSQSTPIPLIQAAAATIPNPKPASQNSPVPTHRSLSPAAPRTRALHPSSPSYPPSYFAGEQPRGQTQQSPCRITGALRKIMPAIT